MINRSSAEGHRDVWGLEHQPCEDRLRNQGLLSQERGQPQGHRTAASVPITVGGAIEKSEPGSSQHCMAGGRETTGLNQERFRLHIRRNFQPPRGQRCTETGPREAVLSPALEVFKTQQDQDRALRNLVPSHTWFGCEQEVRQETSLILQFSLTWKKFYVMSHSWGFHVSHAGVSFIPFQCKEDVFFPKAQKPFYSHNPRKKIKRDRFKVKIQIWFICAMAIFPRFCFAVLFP